MDAHFSKMLAPTGPFPDTPAITFIASAAFAGKKEDFKFQKGSRGIGYYYDRVQVNDKKERALAEETSAKEAAADKKRKRESNEHDDEEEEDGKGSIEKLLDEAEATGVVQLDQFSLKQLLLSFEKKITKNQMNRMKFADEPNKFMESELELHAEIQELFAVAASPELYPVLVQAGAVNSILGCVTHENTDISIAAVGLLQEMTEVDTISDQLEDAEPFIEAFLAAQGLELIVQNLARLDESNEEDAQGVQQTLNVIENLVEIDAEIAVKVCKQTHILKFLLNRCKNKTFDANKLYSSEILSILLQADERNQVLLGTLSEVDGMDELLQCIALYRKKEVTLADEQECVENLFLSLCAALQTRDNQNKFLSCEGFELLTRCLKEQQYAAGCTIQAINYAVLKNRPACARLVDVGGMKYIFPLLTGGGMKKALKRKGSGEKRNLEDSALSIVAQLVTQLGHSTVNDYQVRLLHKLQEREHEKVDRCVELFGKYSRLLAHTEEQIEMTRQSLEEAGDEEELADFEDEDNIYSQRLEGGLFNLQQVSIILAYACTFDAACRNKAELRLSSEHASLEEVLDTLRDMLLTLRTAEDPDLDGENTAVEVDKNGAPGQKENKEKDSALSAEKLADREYKQIITEWCAVLSTLVEGDGAEQQQEED